MSDSVVPSAYVTVMFCFGKSCSVTSNTWTPTPTWPVLVSVHAAWGDRRRLKHFGYWSYFLTSIVIISVHFWMLINHLLNAKTHILEKVETHCECDMLDCLVWNGRSVVMCFIQIVIGYLIQSKVWGNGSFWRKLASDKISVWIVCQKTKSGETVLRDPAWKHTNIWIKYKHISSCICRKFNRNFVHVNIWCNVPSTI